MVLEQDGYGLIIYSVLDLKLTFSTVITVVGANTTVDIMRTFPSVAPTVVLMVMHGIISQATR